MMARRNFVRACLCALVMVPSTMPSTMAVATLSEEALTNPELELRARRLFKRIRCVVCLNQSIDESDAELARDLRNLVRERLQAGEHEHQILDYLRTRYGDFILLK
ncbi:MAG: cytochrome c-type biogenesis protein, partial [Pseudomonadota bacterium]